MTSLHPLQKRGSAHLLLYTLVLFLLLSCGESPEKKFQRFVSAGNESYAAQDYHEAIASWSEALALNKEATNLYQKIGDGYYKLAFYQNAMRAYKKALETRPKDHSTRLKLIKIQLLLKNIDAADKNWAKLPASLNNPEAAILHGDLLSLQRKYQKAEAAYKKSHDLDPNSQTALIRLATNLFIQNKTTEAGHFFQKLINAPQLSPEILLQMSYYRSLQGSPVESEKYLKKALDQSPEDIAFQLQAANFLLETDKLAQATSLLEKIFTNAPDNRYAQKLLIESYLQQKRLTDARILLETAAETGSKDIELLLLRGKYFLLNNDYPAALSQFQTILEHEPKYPLAHYFLALTYLAGGQNKLGENSLIKTLTLNPDFTDAELTLATTYYKNKNYDLALKHAQRIKIREPENFRAHLISGNIHLARNEFPEAIEDFKAASLLDPDLISPKYYRAFAASASGRTNTALDAYAALLENHSTLIDAIFNYARILADAGKSQEALDKIQQAIDKAPDNPYLHHIQGEILLSAGKKQDAIHSFERAIAVQPDFKSSFLKLFDLFANDKKKLEETLEKAIAADKNFHLAHIRLANLYAENGQPQRAISFLEETMATSPKSPLLANNLAWLYIEHQPEDIDEAMRLAQLAYEQLPDSPAVADTLGWIYFMKNMTGRASWLLEQAYTTEPENPLVNFHMGMILNAKGKKTRARKHLEFALERGLHEPYAGQAMEAIRGLDD